MEVILLVENVEGETFRHSVFLRSGFRTTEGIDRASKEARKCGLIIRSVINWRYLGLAELEEIFSR